MEMQQDAEVSDLRVGTGDLMFRAGAGAAGDGDAFRELTEN
jgi:hypothetical protein